MMLAALDPGLVGIVRPALLLPEGLSERLSTEEMQAVLAHEFCHLRRRDNLTFALHMITQTLFWFYPLTWWLGRRRVGGLQSLRFFKEMPDGSDDYLATFAHAPVESRSRRSRQTAGQTACYTARYLDVHEEQLGY